MEIHKHVPLRWRAFRLTKHGNAPEEYEDAFAANAEAGRFAIADGASESSFAALWARLLVDGFVKPVKKPDAGSNWLEPLQKRWAAEVDGKALPWYAEDKRAQGAFATFLGFSFKAGTYTDAGAAGDWTAVAIGDSCLFHVRNEALLHAFPVGHAADFGNQPTLIGSRSPLAHLGQRQKRLHDKWLAGDRLFLATDALAHWFLLACEAGKKPWHALEPFLVAKNAEGFVAWITELRTKNEIRNDDVTLITLDFFKAPVK